MIGTANGTIDKKSLQGPSKMSLQSALCLVVNWKGGGVQGENGWLGGGLEIHPKMFGARDCFAFLSLSLEEKKGRPNSPLPEQGSKEKSLLFGFVMSKAKRQMPPPAKQEGPVGRGKGAGAARGPAGSRGRSRRRVQAPPPSSFGYLREYWMLSVVASQRV